MPKIIIGYWRIRFLLAPIQYLLEVSGLEYELELYDLTGLTGNPEIKNRWFGEKDTLGLELPNLPYLIDGNVRIAQSTAIIRYLARKTGLLGIADNASAEEHARLEMIQDHVNDLRDGYKHYGLGTNVIAFRYPEGYPASIPRQLESTEVLLKDRIFLFGDNISYNDFLLYEVLDVMKMINPDALATHPNLVAYVDRIESLPAMKKFLASPERIVWPVVGPILGLNWGFRKE